MPYEVETLFIYGWGNCWTNDDGSTILFDTKEEAEAAMLEHIEDLKTAVFAGDIIEMDGDDYRVVEVKNGSNGNV